MRNTRCWVDYSRKANVKGYPVVRIARKNVLAHRLSYEIMVGPIPEGMTVDHICGNKVCYNPAHLQLLTRSEHTSLEHQRGVAHNVSDWCANKTHCPAGHEYNNINTYRRPDGGRDCRECRLERTRLWRKRNST